MQHQSLCGCLNAYHLSYISFLSTKAHIVILHSSLIARLCKRNILAGTQSFLSFISCKQHVFRSPIFFCRNNASSISKL